MTPPWIVLGGGGHATVVLDTLLRCGQMVTGYTDPTPGARELLGMECLGGDEVIETFQPGDVLLANGLGSTVSTERRTALYQRFAALGYAFPPIIHPSAIVARSAQIEAGVQVMAGAVLQPSCRLGQNVLINTRASVDHDCIVGANVHIAPGAIICGGVIVEESVHVGTGASIVQGVRIGAGSTVGAGALVLGDVAPGTTVVGVPAKTRDIT